MGLVNIEIEALAAVRNAAREYIKNGSESWKQVRAQAAIAAMQGLLANPVAFENLKANTESGEMSELVIIAKASVLYADTLLIELFETEGLIKKKLKE